MKNILRSRKKRKYQKVDQITTEIEIDLAGTEIVQKTEKLLEMKKKDLTTLIMMQLQMKKKAHRKEVKMKGG